MKRILVLFLTLCMCLSPIAIFAGCDDDSELLPVSVTFPSVTFTYDGTPKSLAIEGTLPEGMTVVYVGNGQTEVGVYDVVAIFADSTGKYQVPSPMSAKLTITKASISGISFSDATVTFSGGSHSIYIKGVLPEGVTVSYSNNGQSRPGTYTVTATFTDSTGRYTVPDPMTATLTITEPPHVDNLPYDLDYSGETIRILGWNAEFDEYDVDLATISTDNVAGAIYERNRNIQDRLGVVLDIDIQEGNAASMENFIRHVANTYNASPDEHYDIISGYSKAIGMLAARGYLIDMMTIEDPANASYVNPQNSDRHMGYIDLDRVYWPRTLADTLSVGNSLYFLTGDMSTNTLYMMYAMYFNKDLIDRQLNREAQKVGLETGTDLLYNYVYDGKWTIDKLIEITTGFGQDINNNGKQDNKDRIGLATSTLCSEALYFGANLRLVEQDPEKILKVSDYFGSRKAYKLVAKLGKWLTTDDVYIDAYNRWHNDPNLSFENAFFNRQTMFMLDRAYAGQRIIDNAPGLKFGVLPIPKYDEKQINYYTNIANPASLYGISANYQIRNNDRKSTVQMLSAVIECWGSKAYDLTTYQIFNVNMLSKWADGEDDVMMFQYIRTSIIFDLGNIFGADLSVMQSKPMQIATFGGSWSQAYQAYIGTIEAQLEELVHSFGF